MIADLEFDGCPVPPENIVGRPGLGLTYVGNAALDHARYTVAWGCVGIGRACAQASLAYATSRVQFAGLLPDHQLIRRALTDMTVNVHAATLLCAHAGAFRDARDPRAVHMTLVAKYFASTMLRAITTDAVQVHGAKGCAAGVAVERHYRDARVMEIIEGSTEMHQLLIAEYELRDVV
jgi:alkylation response protein AidB-like acyl-CoA dehydrogenase